MLCRPIVSTGFLCEEDIEQGFITTNLVRNTCFGQRVTLHVLQGFADGAQLVIASFAAQDLHRLKPRSRSDWVSRQGPELHEPFVSTNNRLVKMLHDLGACPKGRKGEAAANDFAQSANIRRHAKAYQTCLLYTSDAADE